MMSSLKIASEQTSKIDEVLIGGEKYLRLERHFPLWEDEVENKGCRKVYLLPCSNSVLEMTRNKQFFNY